MQQPVGQVKVDVADKRYGANKHRKMFWISRLNAGIYGAFIAWAVLAGSWLPVLLFGLPRLYGGWLHQLRALTQHAGMARTPTITGSTPARSTPIPSTGFST